MHFCFAALILCLNQSIERKGKRGKKKKKKRKKKKKKKKEKEKKGEGRGIGLSKVREILLKYHAGIKGSCEKEECVFEFILPKIKDSHPAVL